MRAAIALAVSAGAALAAVFPSAVAISADEEGLIPQRTSKPAFLSREEGCANKACEKFSRKMLKRSPMAESELQPLLRESKARQKSLPKRAVGIRLRFNKETGAIMLGDKEHGRPIGNVRSLSADVGAF